ncbi:flagellar hook protein FlgE [Denitratisoma oestradiolicum]|uniref:Flagellar hook protein FlgE n=1 Tax=Denitratisoma oestradiolicum TaxID=311182 RepID=A0A6S6XWY8_9PROT|nr:flagellar hook protein FlgE [Denitratisoma oestradiolicum]TWO81601.1 hypothetical protein CBW56_02485 [Denitratisoma oestradiolicum]CAB1370539.1 Flagellar hook protein FlgE [Denitratisoma oestradiolicum]
MGFQQGLSGLNVSAKALDAIGNNVANANTAGFKSSQVRFADVFASSLSGGGGTQVGIGSSVAAIAQQFTQGNVTATNNPLDLAINGSGMYRMSSSGTISYTRNGQFSVDKDGFVVSSGGQRLTGYSADATGAIVPGDYVDIQVSTTNIPPKVTSASQVQLNLDSRATAPVAMSAGSLTANTALATTVTIAAATPNNQLDIWVDGVLASVTIPDGNYTPADMATTLSSLINTALGTSGASVDVTTNAGGKLVFTSGSLGTVGSNSRGSSISIAASSNADVILGNLPTGGPVLGTATPTPGAYTGITPVTFPLTITTGQNDSFSLYIDGTLYNVTLPPGNYPDPAGVITAPDLDLLDEINSELGLTAPVAPIGATLDGSDNLVITSPTTGTASSVFVTGGNGVSDLFGTSNGADNFDASNTLSYTGSTAQTVYDSLGNPHNLTMYFVKTSAGNGWQMYTTLDGGGQSGPVTLDFTTAGALATDMPLTQTFTLNNGATSPLTFTLDLRGTTQYGISFGVNQLLQDGFTSGRLSGLSVSGDGIVQGRYSNGKARNMGQVVLVNFNNPNGLLSMGGNQWAETAESGQPIPGTPGQGSLGSIQSAAVEESNVDLTKELVDMITQQRVYQANAQTIKTQDSVLQTLVNLR